MNEISEVRTLWAEADEPGAARLAQLRRRLVDEADARPVPAAVPARRPWRGWGVRAAVAGGLGVAAAAGFALVPGGDGGGGVPGLNAPPANAAELLTRAAAAAESGGGLHPRGDQFVHHELTGEEITIADGGDAWLRRVRYEEWQRADGAFQALRRKTQIGVAPLPGKKLPDRAKETDPPGAADEILPCSSKPATGNAPYAVNEKLPTDPAGLLAVLKANAGGPADPATGGKPRPATRPRGRRSACSRAARSRRRCRRPCSASRARSRARASSARRPTRPGGRAWASRSARGRASGRC
ncbi:hypothetical protein ACFQHO_12065 [Actinomadura yumaensis]|uniref:hypothetical protein n=1 Tax=Actinomadura yumaensis TaxID=111807 RepID=UPI003608C15E